MKGLHLTIDSWRPFRGADGYKLRGKELDFALAWGLEEDLPCRRSKEDFGEEVTYMKPLGGRQDEEPPLEVKAVPRLIPDLAYLTQLTEAESPPRQLYRAKHSVALFVVGDASGKAKGTVVVT